MAELTQTNRGPGRLRELLAGSDPVVAPGAYDALSARLAEQAGFDAVYMTGFGASASLLGRPDVGLLSFGEMADHARRLVQAVAVPVIADVERRVQALDGARVGAGDDHRGQRLAAVEARRSDDLGARRYREAGADALFVEAPESEREVEAVAEAFPGTPLVFNGAEGGRTPPIELGRLRELGFRLVLAPITALLAATRAVQEALSAMRAGGTPAKEGALAFPDFLELIGLPEIQRLEERFTA